MDHQDMDQYFSVNNGLYYVKRTNEDVFCLLTESGEWKYDPRLSDEYYDVLSGYVEITEEAMKEVICERKETQVRKGKAADENGWL